MDVIQVTGWRLDYVMDGISIGALRTLLNTEESEKPKGMLADPNLNVAELGEMGFGVMAKEKK